MDQHLSLAGAHQLLSLSGRVAEIAWQLQKDLALTETAFGATVALAMGSERAARGEYADALPLLEHAVRVSRAHHGLTHEQHLGAIERYTAALGELGRVSEVVLILEESIEGARRSNHESIELSRLKQRLGDIYCARGFFDRARPLLEEAVAQLRRAHSKPSRDLIESLLQAAARLDLPMDDVYSARGRLGEASALIEASDDVWWSVLARFNHAMLSGQLAAGEKRLDDAVGHYDSACQIASSFADEDGPLIDATIAAANVLALAGRDHEAVDRMNAVVARVGIDAISRRPVQFAEFLNQFCRAGLRTGLEAPYSTLILRATRALADAVRDEWPIASEERRLELTSHVWRQVRRFLALIATVLPPLDDEQLQLIYEWVLVLKGAIGHSMSIGIEHQLAQQHPECRADLERLARIRRRLQSRYADVFYGLPQSAEEAAAQGLRLEKARLEQALFARIPNLSPLRDHGVSILAIKLPLGSVLLDFVKTDGGALGVDDDLVVFMTPAFKHKQLRAVRLPGWEHIHDGILRFRHDLQRHARGEILSPDYSRMWTTFWEPIERVLSEFRDEGIECSTLIVSADDSLAVLPFAAIRNPEWDSSEFLLDRYEIRHVTHAVSQLGIDHRPPPGGRPLAMGVNQFCAVVRETDPQTAVFPALTHAEDEAREIARRFGGEVWTGSQVTKRAIFDRLAHVDRPDPGPDYRSPCLLHIATHGLLEDPEDAPSPAAALRHAVLALGGDVSASATAAGSVPDTHPSLLDAFDVSCLDLRNTALTVLSACEAGLGRIAAGEGVYSLQRAFMQAGARSVVMPLWSVHDGSMRLLMTEFYNELASGRHSAAALRTAQRRVRDTFPWPAVWSGVVAVGRTCVIRSRTDAAEPIEFAEPM